MCFNVSEQHRTKKPFKYFISYNDNNVNRTLCIKLPQMFGNVEYFDSNETMCFKVSDKKLLKKYTKYGKNSNLINKEFDSGPVYDDNDKCIKTRIKSYGHKINTNFQRNKTPKENVPCKCLSLVILDSVIRVNKKHCFWWNVNLKQKKTRWRIKSMMTLTQVHLMNLVTSLIIMTLMINLLKIKPVF